MGFRRFLGNVEKTLYRAGLFSAEKLTLPDFLCIGAQKAGTTWLYENLRLHPDIYLTPRKELHYFDWQYSRPLRDYARQFSGAGNKVKGDVTPGYGVISKDRIGFIHAIMPRAKFLMLLRNPVDRAWSHAVMGLCTVSGRPIDEINVDEFIAHFRSPRSVRLGSYSRIIANWETKFPRNQILIEFFDDIISAPQVILSRVFGFLGVTIDVDWDLFPLATIVRPHGKLDAAPASPVTMPDACRDFLETFYRDEIDRLSRRFGDPVTRWSRQ